MKTIKSQIKEVVSGLTSEYIGKDIKDLKVKIEYPDNPKYGDYSTNFALKVAKIKGEDGAKIGKKIASNLLSYKAIKRVFDKVEFVSPGFINFHLKPKWLKDQVKIILKLKDKFGKSKIGQDKKVQVEFISANPTGPLTLPNGRGGMIGDTLANVLELLGFKVQREYYINDAGNQINLLGKSLAISLGLFKKEEEYYKGDYIDRWARSYKYLIKEYLQKEKLEDLGRIFASHILTKAIKPAIEKIDIKFDRWFSEYQELRQRGLVEEIISYLKKKSFTYEKEGALWMRTTKFSDDKDRVLIKKNGEFTYFPLDLAYHWHKFKIRKFDKVIDIWGADHAGHKKRMLCAMKAIGEAGKLEIIIMQMVRLVKEKKEVKMSKRKGFYITLNELIEETGKDVARFFFLMRKPESHLDFDLKLAKERSEKNPVYYVQYAYARICSILRQVEALKHANFNANYRRIKKCEYLEPELNLIKELIKWPEIVEEVGQSYEVHRLPFYAISLSESFHDFYEKCRVIDKGKVIKFRFDLIRATKQVLGEVLKAMGIARLEKM